MRIQDDEKGLVPVFEMFPQINAVKTKEAGRPIFDEIELCRIYIAGNKQNIGAFPAHDIWRMENKMTEWGEVQNNPVTYAMRFNKQYLEFKSGGKQSFSGTLLTELPFLSSAKRLELKALNIHTAETLASLDGAALKMLGPGGRELKNQAMAYMESAEKNKGSVELASELSKRDAMIEDLKRRLDSLTGTTTATPETVEAAAPEAVKTSTVDGFASFENDDLRAWLTDAGVNVDMRWSRNTMLGKAEEILAKQGKLKTAA